MKKINGPYYPVGTRVRSHYNAMWTGNVIEIQRLQEVYPLSKGDQYIAVCLITHDRYGNPMRKPIRSMRLNTLWLEEVK